MSPLPATLAANPRLDRWVQVEADGTITIRSGKVEIGQGIATAIAAIAARELGVGIERLRLVSGDTRLGPDEGLTTGSQSVEAGGASMRRAAALVRTLFTAAAARMLDVPEDAIAVADGAFAARDRNRACSYWDLREEVNLAVSAAALPVPIERGGSADGAALRRIDLRGKLSGGAFIQDMRLPGMLHGRVIRGRNPAARPVGPDLSAIAAMPGVVSVVVDGDFLGVVARREDQARRAAAKARLTWQAQPLPADTEGLDWMDPGSADTRVLIDEPGAAAVVTLERSYARPYLAHGSIGPCCAVASWGGGRLTVWSHSQGVFMLRRQLARVLRIAAGDVDVVHAPGAGCYGHNGADDVALDAALLARAAGAPVMCCWSRAEEFSASPAGAAMRVRLAAALGADGRIRGWVHEVWSTPHVARPVADDGTGLLAGPLLADPTPASAPAHVALPAGAGERNAVPIYRTGPRRIVHHRLSQGPLRSSALRSLGAHCNVFAIESFLDELAATAGIDPVAFRLAHLDDPRARGVIAAAARMAGWDAHAAGGEGVGRGIGFARYKNISGYCAVVAEVEARDRLFFRRAFVAVDCGAVVHRDGLLNQIEGGVVQAASWTLCESLHWDADGPTVLGWADYPVLRFSDVPAITVEIIATPSDAALGAGEVATGPTAAALANALAHALGVRVRRMPLTPDRIGAAIEAG